MALNPTGIATAIAGLSVAGVTILDYPDWQAAVDIRRCPLIQPDAEKWIEDEGVTRETMGPDSNALKTVRYVLNYVYFYGPVGMDRGPGVIAQDAIARLYLFKDALIANSAIGGAIEAVPVHDRLATVFDPAQIEFHGCHIAVHVEEWVNP